MTGYIDLFLLALPKAKLAAYRRLARRFAKIMEDHGALQYREYIAEDLKVKCGLPFTDAVKIKAGEVLISSVIEFRSKAHRNQVNKKAWADQRMRVMCAETPLFDMQRMYYGGFKTIIEMNKEKTSPSRARLKKRTIK